MAVDVIFSRFPINVPPAFAITLDISHFSSESRTFWTYVIKMENRIFFLTHKKAWDRK